MKSLLFATGLGMLILSANTYCTKINPTDIGTDILPAVDNVHTFDTVLRVYADNYLYNDSSIVTYGQAHALGMIADDPEFGKTEGQIYFSVVPMAAARNPFTSIDSIVGMDSVILSLAYTDIYGDSNAVQKINVYEINDADFKDSIGYMVQHPGFEVLPGELGSAVVNFTTLNDPKTIVVKGDTTVIENQMRIPLDPSLGLRFAAYDTTSVYVKSNRDSAFQKVFNGLALKVDEGGSSLKDALAYFNLNSENTKLTFYFRVKKNGAVDTVSTDFVLYASSYEAYSANIIKRVPAAGYAALSQTAGVIDADKVYIQSAPGSYALLRVPGLSGLDNRLIHRAEISFQPLDLPGNDIYTVPDLLFADLSDSTNNRFITIKDDFAYSFTNYSYDYKTFGGYLKDNRFFVNVTRYVQSLVSHQDPNYTFRLYAPKVAIANYSYPRESGMPVSPNALGFTINSYIAKGRVVVGGGSNAERPMVLRIIYSKI